MLKINDLEELVKTPLGGTLGASTSGLPMDEAMDVGESIELSEEEKLVAQFSPNEANIGLLQSLC